VDEHVTLGGGGEDGVQAKLVSAPGLADDPEAIGLAEGVQRKKTCGRWRKGERRLPDEKDAVAWHLEDGARAKEDGGAARDLGAVGQGPRAPDVAHAEGVALDGDVELLVRDVDAGEGAAVDGYAGAELEKVDARGIADVLAADDEGGGGVGVEEGDFADASGLVVAPRDEEGGDDPGAAGGGGRRGGGGTLGGGDGGVAGAGHDGKDGTGNAVFRGEGSLRRWQVDDDEPLRPSAGLYAQDR
jgi:hypothetical protein